MSSAWTTDTLRRWLVFNAVGVLGFGVQLGALAVLARAWPGHPLAATACALELTLLHNFAWHTRVTWKGRVASRQPVVLEGRAGQLVRFHLNNGLVSLAGNLLLVRVLSQVRCPLLAADAVAVIACAVVNFQVSERWVFASGVTQDTAGR